MQTFTDSKPRQEQDDFVWLVDEPVPIDVTHFILRPEPLPIIEA